MAPFGPGSSTLLAPLDRGIASAMAVVLEAMFSMTATAPAETIVADFKREPRLVVRLTVTFLTKLGVTTPASRACGIRDHGRSHLSLSTVRKILLMLVSYENSLIRPQR